LAGAGILPKKHHYLIFFKESIPHYVISDSVYQASLSRALSDALFLCKHFVLPIQTLGEQARTQSAPHQIILIIMKAMYSILGGSRIRVPKKNSYGIHCADCFTIGTSELASKRLRASE
jgi:hypothetical protein